MAGSPKTPSANSKRTSGSITPHSPISSGTGCGGTPARFAHNVARWIRHLALPAEFARCRGKRLRIAFFNAPARVVTHARRTWLRLPRTHAWAAAFIEALTRIRALPAYA
ncbi:MAG: transposase [Ilumatobacteraceae bacterium]